MKRFELEPSRYGDLSQVKMNCDKPLTSKTIKPPFPNQSFSMCVAGGPGSGKTSFILSLLKKPKRRDDNIYHRVFKHIIFVCPTSSRSSIENSPLADLPTDCLFDELDYSVEEKINEYKDEYTEQRKDYATLLIIDDLGTSLSRHVEMLSHLMMNRRHKNLSVILMVQYSISLPKSLRAQVSHPVLFRPSKQDHDTIRKEYTDMNKTDYESFARFVWKKKHDSVIIDREKGLYYKNLQLIKMH